VEAEDVLPSYIEECTATSVKPVVVDPPTDENSKEINKWS